jgi:hypothetical protein
MPLELHESLVPLGFLLGTWTGGGKGAYPSIDAFEYGEEMIFEHVGDDFLLYAQRSWSPTDGAPIHFERGFVKRAPDGELELALAHPLGLTEIAHGRLDGTAFEFRTGEGGMGRTHTGLPVTGIVRRYTVDADVLRYELEMATETIPMGFHLRGELRRQP